MFSSICGSRGKLPIRNLGPIYHPFPLWDEMQGKLRVFARLWHLTGWLLNIAKKVENSCRLANHGRDSSP
jgi:hypothetical protein